jgi:hypothetical protein
MLVLCKQHFAFLGKLSQAPYLYQIPKAGGKRERVSTRRAIMTECLAAMEKIEAHFAAKQLLENAVEPPPSANELEFPGELPGEFTGEPR